MGRYLLPVLMVVYGLYGIAAHQVAVGLTVCLLGIACAFLAWYAAKSVRKGLLVYAWSLTGLLATGAVTGAVVGAVRGDGAAKGLAVLAGAAALNLGWLTYALQQRLPRDAPTEGVKAPRSPQATAASTQNCHCPAK